VTRVIEREQLLAQLRPDQVWDVLVIGGGATGLGIALDAAARGFRTALIEARDFAGGTSARSTKLIHGGVRYLAQGNFKLVREALLERALLLANAPQLVRPLKFIVPCYRPLERETLRLGLGLYDMLAGKQGIGDTEWLSRADTITHLPGVRQSGLHGGVAYWDAQFDDARLAIALMRTAVRLGAVAINYVEAEAIAKQKDRVTAITARDGRSGERFELRAKVVFNAAGVWADSIRKLADPASIPLTTISRGSHVVIPGSFLPGSAAMLIPRTDDGRVLFAIPWDGRVLIGTTDVAAMEPTWEPAASASEVEFILVTARNYLQLKPSNGDVLATFAGLRPLFSPYGSSVQSTATRTLSREHAIAVEHQNLVTIVGGKWTTYRRMALDALDQAAEAGLIAKRPCTTGEIKLEVDDALETACRAAQALVLAGGNDSGDVELITSFAWMACQFEQAVCADDVLARRLRIASLDQRQHAHWLPIVEQAFVPRG